MKKLFFLATLLIVGSANSQTYEWAFNAGGATDDYGNDLITDASGNVYVTGAFKTIVDFDPSAGSANLTSKGAADIFIAKYDALGNYLWAFNIGGTSDDVGNGITIDASGSVYVSGYFNDTADFDPSANLANLTATGILGKPDIFIAKYDASGNYLWAFNLGQAGEDRGNRITTDNSGNVYTIGCFQGLVDFDPSGNTAILSADGWNDLFVAKYDTGGNYVWAFNLGGNDSDEGYGIATDTSGNVYVTGWFQNLVDFDKSGNMANINSNGSTDIFVAKYDPSANYLWAFNIGGTGTDNGYGITTDISGNVYVTGNFQDTADFDPSANTFNLIAEDWNDLYVAKYDTGGNYLWAFNIGGAGSDVGKDITSDVLGDVYVSGRISYTADFDPSGSTANITSNGADDAFIARYDANGNYLWAFNIGGTNNDIGNGIATNVSGDVYVTGSFQNTADFDPTGNVINFTANGADDVFIAKYSDLLSIDEINPVNSFLLFPNPTTGEFAIKSKHSLPAVLILYDLTGRRVFQQQVASSQQLIDASFLSKGMYIWQLGIELGKLIIK